MHVVLCLLPCGRNLVTNPLQNAGYPSLQICCPWNAHSRYMPVSLDICPGRPVSAVASASTIHGDISFTFVSKWTRPAM